MTNNMTTLEVVTLVVVIKVRVSPQIGGGSGLRLAGGQGKEFHWGPEILCAGVVGMLGHCACSYRFVLH